MSEQAALVYEPLGGDRHRHVGDVEHAHPHRGPHTHDQPRQHEHGHSHGLVHGSIKRSREGVRAVSLSLAVLGVAAVAQTIVFIASGSIALLADLIHNFGDALTARAIGNRVRASLSGRRATRRPCSRGRNLHKRLRRRRRGRPTPHPSGRSHPLAILALAGAIGYAGNFFAARVRTRAGRLVDSPALTADGAHARADAYVSLAVIASAIVVALGAPIADPIIGLAITLVILRITWKSWRTVKGQSSQ